MADEPVVGLSTAEHSQELLWLAADWIWEQDESFRFIKFEVRGADADIGFDGAKLLGKRCWECELEMVDGAGWAAHRALQRQREPFRDVLVCLPLPDGSRHYICLSGYPVFSRSGRFAGYRGCARDITWRQRHHNELLRLRAAIDASPDVVFLTDAGSLSFLYVNGTVCKYSGYSASEYLSRSPMEVTGYSSEALRALYAEVIASGERGLTTPATLIESRDGTYRGWWEAHRRAVRIGGRWIIVTVSRDVTARRHAEEATSRAKRMFAAVSAVNEAILRVRAPEQLYQQVCDAAVEAGSFVSAAILDMPSGLASATIVTGAGRSGAELRQVLLATKRGSEDRPGLVGLCYLSGQPCVSNDFLNDERVEAWHTAAVEVGVKSAAAIPLLKDGAALGVLLLCADARCAFDDEIVKLLEHMAASIAFGLENLERESERASAEARARYLATHDNLTGLPNRVLFGQVMELAIQAAQRYERRFAVMFIDLDRFKLVNDTLGHHAGDDLLKQVAARLKRAVRASDLLARLGGDEFVVLVQEVDAPEDAAVVARKVLAAAIEPVTVLGQECRVTASIGIALYPDHGEDEQALMKNADVAMYLAKEAGKNNFQFFVPGAKTQSFERLALEASLRTALEEEQFLLHYQSKLDLNTRRITGVEALLRWQHPALGMIQPNRFIPVAEETGAIVPIGKWVLDAACAQNMEWQRQGLPSMTVAVNLSPRQFADESLLIDVAAALDASGMPPELLELEVTEGMVMQNPERAVRILGRMKDMGVRIAIDDFGVGYSSLARLRGFPVDTLKVDRSFVRNLPGSEKDSAITKAIVAMAKTLGLKVVAEGVETVEQEAFLHEIACDESQGFYFSRPLAADELAQLLSLNSDGSGSRELRPAGTEQR